MQDKSNLLKIVSFLLIMFFWLGCKNHKAVKDKEIVKAPEKMDDQVSENIKSFLLFAQGTNGVINDSLKLKRFDLVNSFYEKNDYQGIWSKMETWNPVADSMFDFIKNAKYNGLYPEDYHYKELNFLRTKIEADSLTKMDAIVWTKADLMLTDAFIETLKDLKEGRIMPDSISIVSNPNYVDTFFLKNLESALASGNVSNTFKSLQPTNRYYVSLKELLPDFVDNMDTQKFVFVQFPYKDTLAFYRNLHERLLQEGIGKTSKKPDSIELSKEVKDYQARHKMKADGKAGAETVRALNSNDNEKFRRIAVTLDRFKQFPALPDNYLMVNLPSQSLQVWDHDTVVLRSKVIIGKPSTPTPLLSSAISNMVTFPNWTIPESIIKKEILPALKINPGYLDSKGFSLVDKKGDFVDPYSVNWSKYKEGIPWKVIQDAGEDNALGIFKFNFSNPYSVYLHDTNQRYLFANSDRALSHGCVRVQNWEALAFYIAGRDSAAAEDEARIPYDADSIRSWIANQAHKTIMIKKKLPLFIQYFTCEAKDNHIVFYKDVYNEDEMIEQKYFADK